MKSLGKKENKIMKNNQIDMTTGSIVGKQIRFIIPLMFTGILQLLYNAVDIIVVGKFAGTTALSAVGSTGALVNLFINVFLGLSVGTSVVTSLYFGSKDDENVHRTVHTSLSLAIIAGLALIVLGYFGTPVMLKLMSSPEDVIGQSTLYMRIIFVGMPFNLLYNFSAAILRAVGDTKRPLIFLSISGVVNVILNLIFVIIFHLDVAGVALATIISQALAVVLISRYMMRSDTAIKLTWRKLHIYKEQFWKIVRIGVPAGIQGSFFSLSNVLIQSSINSFGALAMAGNAAAGNLEGFVYIAMNCVHQSAITFAGQNRGAGEYKRIRKNTFISLGLVIVIGVIMGGCFLCIIEPLVGLYTSDATAIAYGVQRLRIILSLYFICGMMDTMTGHIRGLGHSIVPMIITFLGVCVFRVVWIFTVFAKWESLLVLYYSYPITWSLSLLGLLIYYFVVVRKEIIG